MCVPDVVENLNVNETRDIEWHETCKCKCRLYASICNNKQPWNNDKCRCECKELIDKGVWEKGFIWNPSNCQCECDKSCDIGEYLDYENCRSRKKLVDELIEECTVNIDEVKIAECNSVKNIHKCSFCTLHFVLFSVIFTFNIGIFTYFVYYKCMNRDGENVSRFDYVYQAKIININGKSQTNRDQKSNLLFSQQHNQSQKFQIKLVKNRQKALQKH